MKLYDHVLVLNYAKKINKTMIKIENTDYKLWVYLPLPYR